MPTAGAGLHDRRVGGVRRAEYTVGVSGCDKRIVFTVICPDGGEGCFAAGSGRWMVSLPRPPAGVTTAAHGGDL